jgi:anti-sigma factor RsiW
MSPCPNRETLLPALVDGELDAANALAAETHLRTCQICAAHYRTLMALRTRLREAEPDTVAPSGLRLRIEALIDKETQREDAPRSARVVRPRRWWTGPAAGWSTAGAMTAIAASLLVIQLAPLQTTSLEDQLVGDHVRSLLASHLIDVVTSDRHVVKPWFNGKIDFAPPVVELADQGFPLAGGRLDYAGDREVAALVYRRRAHVINLFVMPAKATPVAWRPRPAATGYSVVHWTRGGLDFWAVSDIEAGELEVFHKAFAARAPA